MDAALASVSADRSLAVLALREVTRQAGLAPTSFLPPFHRSDELGHDSAWTKAAWHCATDAPGPGASFGNGDDWQRYGHLLIPLWIFAGQRQSVRLMLRERTGVGAFRTAD